jgi:ABC-type antimicrobial peptide transport system permease subunit
MTVVGVVADLKHDRLDQPTAPMWYVPVAQASVTAYGTPLQMFVILRTTGSPMALVQSARSALAEVDPTAPIARIQPLTRLVDTSISGRTFTGTLLESFGLLALFLACIGVYSVSALAVTERRNEIGLRKAFGAGAGSIVGLVAREYLVIVAAGGALGLAGGMVATRLMQSLLFGVGGADGVAVAGTVIALGLTALIAAALPAWRAARVEALVSLRVEE